MVTDAFGERWRKNENGLWDQSVDKTSGGPVRRNTKLDLGKGSWVVDEIPGYGEGTPTTPTPEADTPTPEPEAPATPETDIPEPPGEPSALKPFVSAEEMQNIKEQSMLDHVKEQGRYPLPRGAQGFVGETTDIAEGAKRDYKKVYDLLSERNPEIGTNADQFGKPKQVVPFNEAYPDFEAFWDKVQNFGVDDSTRAYDAAEPGDPDARTVIPEEMKVFNRAYAEAVLGLDPDGELTLYRNVINNPLEIWKAGTGYWSTDKDFAKDYGATEDKNRKDGSLNGFYTGRFRPDQIGGMLGYSRTEDEFAVVIGPDVAGQEGRVTRVGDVEPSELPDFLLNMTIKPNSFGSRETTGGKELEATRATGGSAFRFNALAGAMNFSKVDNNPMGEGFDEFLADNNITREEWAQRYDALYGEGSYAEAKEAGNNPSYQKMKAAFIQDEDGKWFLDVLRIDNPDATSLSMPFYSNTNPKDWKNDRFDAKMKMLGLVQDITGVEFMSPRQYDVPETTGEERISPPSGAESPESSEAPSILRSSVSAEEMQNIKEQSITEAITEEGRFPLPREATANRVSDIQKGAKRDYQKVYDLLSERDPEFTKTYPDMDSFWDEVRSLGVHGQYRAPDSQDMISEVTKKFNRAYAEAVLGMDPDGDIVVYRNAVNLPLSVEKAGVGYWSTDKDFAQAYGADPERVEASKNGEAELNGFYEGRFRPDQINGMIGYSQVEDEFAVVISPDTAEEPGRVTRIGPLDPPKIPEWLNLNSIKGLERQGGTVFRHFNLAGALNLNKVDKNPLGDGDSDDFLKENGLEGSSWREEFDKVWGAGSYDEMIDEGDIPPYSELKRLFVQDDDGKWFLDVENIAGKGLYRGYSGSGNPDDYKNDRFDSTLKVLETIQNITGEKFMSVKRDEVPEPREMPERDEEAPITDIEEPAAPEAVDELPEGGEVEVEEVAPEPEAAPTPPPDGPPPGGEDEGPRPPKKDPKDMSYEELKEEFETPLPADATEEDYQRYSEVTKAFYAMGGYARTDTRKDPKDMSWEELKEEYETPLPADATDADYDRNAKVGREFYSKGGYAGPLPETSEELDFTPDELAIGYGASKDGEDSYIFDSVDGDGGDIIVEKLPNGRWNVRYFRALDPAGIDVIDTDIDDFDTPEEAFDFANGQRNNPEQFDPVEAIRDREDGEEAPVEPTPETEPTPEEEEEASEAEEEAPATDALEVPEGYYPIDPTEEWIPEGAAEDQESPDFTDDPVELAERYSEERLTEALRQGVEGTPARPANGFGFLDFEDGDEAVPAEAIFNALIEQGADARDILRKIYAGDRDVAEPEVQEVEEPEEAEATLEDLADPSSPFFEWPAALDSLSDEEKQQIIEGENAWLDNLMENNEFDAPEGYSLPDGDPFPINQQMRPDDAPDWFPDSPLALAGFAQSDYLEQALRDSVRPDAENPGFAEIGFETEDGESYSALIPNEAVRDALQLQGIDTNEILEEELQSDPTPEEVESALEGEGVDEVETVTPPREWSEGEEVSREEATAETFASMPAGTIITNSDGWQFKKTNYDVWYVLPQGKKKPPFPKAVTDAPPLIGDDKWTIDTVGTNTSVNDLDKPIQKAKELNLRINELSKQITKLLLGGYADLRDKVSRGETVSEEDSKVDEMQQLNAEKESLEAQLDEIWGDRRQAFYLLKRLNDISEAKKGRSDEELEEANKRTQEIREALLEIRDRTTDQMAKADAARAPKISPEPTKPENDKLLEPLSFESEEDAPSVEEIEEEKEKSFPPYGMPGSDQVPNSLPDELPEGWEPVEGADGPLVKNENGDFVGLVDKPGAKYWFVLTGNSDDNEVFQTPEEAFEHYNKLRESIGDVGDEERVTPPTDIEPPASADELPDAGETEVVDTRPEPQATPAPGSPPNEPPETETTTPPNVLYRWKSGLATMSGRAGAPFRNKEIQDYIRSKGFRFVETLPNGKRIFSETAEMSLAEFKEVLRELRDRYNLKLAPRFEGEDMDIDAPDTEEAEAPQTAETKVVQPGGRVAVEMLDIDLRGQRSTRPGTVAAEDLEKFNSLIAEKDRLYTEWKEETLDRDIKDMIYRNYYRASQELDALFTRKPKETPVASRFGDEVSNEWVDNDENTSSVNDAPLVEDIQVGDFIPASDGGWHEVINLEPDPDDPDGTIVTKMRLSNGEVFRGRKTTKRSPGLGWANGKEISGLRRRNDFAGLSREEIEERAVKTPEEMSAESPAADQIAPAAANVPMSAGRPTRRGVFGLKRPLRPAFLGRVKDIIRGLKKKDGPSLLEALKGERIVYFDFETIGTGNFDYENPDQPIALAAYVYENGEKVDEINLFINPGVPLGGYYHEGDNTDNPMKEGRMLDADGNPITNEWLATQPGIKEQLEKFIQFAGQNPIFVAQNAEFDTSMLEFWARQNGMDFTAESVIDTLALAEDVFPNMRSKRLANLIEALGIEADPNMWHNANADARVLPQLLEGLLRKADENNREFDMDRAEAAFDAAMEQFRFNRAQKEAEQAQKNITPTDADDIADPEQPVQVQSVVGDMVSNEWVEDNENTDPLSGMRTEDLRVGDFIGAADGGWHEVLDLEPDPVNEEAIIITKRRLSNGEVHRGNKRATKDGRLGWFKSTKIEKVRRRKGDVTTDMTPNEPVYSVVPSTIPGETPSSKNEAASVVASGIDEAIENNNNVSNNVNDSAVQAASQPSPEDVVIDPNRESFPDAIRVDVNGTPLRKLDRIRHKKTGRIATVREPIEEFKSGSSVYTTYIKIKYDDKAKREAANPANFELIREGEEPASIYTNEAPEPATIPETVPSTPENTTEPPAGLPSEPGLTDEEAEERRQAFEALDPFSAINDDVEDSNTYEINITAKELEAAFDAIDPSFGGFRGGWADGPEGEALGSNREREIYRMLETLLKGKGGKKQLTPREMYTIQDGIERDISYYAEAEEYLTPEEKAARRALLSLNGKISEIRSGLGLVPNPQSKFAREQGVSSKYESLVKQREREAAELREQQEYAADLRDDETPTVEDLDQDPEDYEEEAYPPTKEQRRIISAIMTGKSVVVRALAGTGKTSTLKLAAQRLLREKPDAKIVYVAFNKSVEVEASSKMPKNVEARTADSIAFQADINANLKKKYTAQKNGEVEVPRTKDQIAERLGIENEDRIATWPSRELYDGSILPGGEADIVDVIRDAVDAWTISDKDNIFDLIPNDVRQGISDWRQSNDKGYNWFVELLGGYIEDLKSPDGVFPINNAHLTKFWAMSKPDLGATGSGLARRANIVFFDEAQDINPVLAKVIADQKMQKVYVGDGNQAIYGFRGAVDQLDQTEAPFDLPMTQSFRFGPKIAGFANRFLDLLGSRYRLRGSGPEGARVGDVENPDAILARTNAGVVRSALQEISNGKTVAVPKSTKDELQSLVRTVRWFKEGGTKPRVLNADLAEFKDWGAAQDAANLGDNPKVRTLVNLVEETFGGDVRALDDFVENLRIESQISKDVGEAPVRALDGDAGDVGENLQWRVEGTDLIIKGSTFESKDIIKGVGGARWNSDEKHWFFPVNDDDDRLNTLNRLRDAVVGGTDDVPEILITTAHKSKGMEWERVRLFDDFFRPREDPDTGETIMPSPEEMRLNYVAATRGRIEIDPGGLDWIFAYSSDEAENPNRGDGMSMGLEMAMAAPSEASNEDIANIVSSTKDKLDDASEAVANLIIEQLESGVAPWQKPWVGGNFLPVSYATGKSYNGSNIWHLLAWKAKNGWADNRWLTKNQAEKLGGFIPEGVKGTIIVYSGRTTKTQTDEATGEEKEYSFFSTRFYEVFNTEQVQGIEFEAVEVSAPVPVGEGEQQVLDLYTNKPPIRNNAQDEAYYAPMLDVIMLPLREQFPTPEAYFETLVHELAHSTGHSSRLDRTDLTDHYGDHRSYRGLEELIAEITVALVAGRLNIDFEIENVSSYAEGWLKTLKNDKNMIFKATAAAQAAADYMLGDVGKNNGKPHVGEEGQSLVKPDFNADPNFLSGKAGDEYADDLRALVKSGKPVVFKYIKTLKNGETRSSIADGVPLKVWTNAKSGNTNVQILSSKDGETRLTYTLSNIDSLTPEEITEYSSSRETIGDVGKEQEPEPVTDIEPPASADELPDAGETEIEVIEAPVAADPGGDDPPGGGNRGPNFAPPPNDDEDDGGPEPIDEPFDPLSVDTGREVKSRGYNLLHTPEDFKDVEKPQGYQSPTIISPPPESERKRGDFYEVDFNLYRDIVDSMSKDIPIIFSYGKEIISGVPLRTWSLGTSNPVVEVEMDNGTVSNFSPSRFRYIDPNEYSNILDNLGFRTSEDRNVGDEPPNNNDGGTPVPPPGGPEGPDDLPPIDIPLTEGGTPLPQVTTWDRFYQAAVRSGAIENPIDELDAVNMIQDLAREDGFEAYEVPATPRSWQRGRGTRKPQKLWWEYLRRIGMNVRTSEDRNVGESGRTGDEIRAEDFADYFAFPDRFYDDTRTDDSRALTPIEQDAVESYQGTDNAMINDRLRRNPEFASESIVESLDKAATTASLTKPTLLYRVVKMNIDDPEYQGFQDLQRGDIISDAGFMSTTINKNWALNDYLPRGRYNASTILEIEAPAGTKGMVPAAYTSKLREEYEFVLPRNTQLQVVSVSPVTGIVTVRIVP